MSAVNLQIPLRYLATMSAGYFSYIGSRGNGYNGTRLSRRLIRIADPRMSWVIDTRQTLGTSGQHIEIISRVSRRTDHRMISLWHNHGVIIGDPDKGVDRMPLLMKRRSTIGVNMLQRVAIWLVDLDRSKLPQDPPR